jgi:hypothetical protein
VKKATYAETAAADSLVGIICRGLDLINPHRQAAAEILVYNRMTAALLRDDFPHFPLVTHNPTRKRFFAKLLGVAAAVNLLPKMLVRSIAGRGEAPVSGVADARPIHSFPVQSEPRAVARRDDTV